MCRLEPNDSCQEPRGIKVVRRILLFEGLRNGYPVDIPTESCGRVSEEIFVTSVQSVLLKVGVKLEKFDWDEETHNWPLRELAGSVIMWLVISTRPDISY